MKGIRKFLGEKKYLITHDLLWLINDNCGYIAESRNGRRVFLVPTNKYDSAVIGDNKIYEVRGIKNDKKYGEVLGQDIQYGDNLRLWNF